MRERILEYCEQTFMRYGIRSVSMDAIAVGLGISKKTIYQYFKDKEEIIKALLEKGHNEDCVALKEIDNKAKDPIEKFFLAFKYYHDELCSINPALIYDLRKYHPDAWETFCIRKENDPLHMVSDILVKGIEQGLFRPEINIKIMSRFIVRIMDMMADGVAFPASQFKIVDIHTELMTHYIYGIATEEGRKLIEKHKSILTQNSIN